MAPPSTPLSAHPPIIDAVTAVLSHGGEVFLVRRADSLSAFPGFSAFPGGKVDRSDADDPFADGLFAGHEPRVMRALIRELREELGFDLESCDGVRALHPFGRIATPPGVPFRFDTRFVRVDLHERPDFVLEPAEIAEGDWRPAQAWLDGYEAGEVMLAPPTLWTLQALASDPGAKSAALDVFDIDDIMPAVEVIKGLRHAFVRSNTLPPAAHTNCFLIGDAGAHRVLVDPSPCSREELHKLLRLTGEAGFHEVFLTHHHPDHCEFADEIARRSGVPFGMSAWTRDWFCRHRPAFLEGIEVRTYADADIVTRWLGHTVRALAVPGHDEGQLALMPDNRAWCIVGDLIQGIGTVVIAPPEGNMRRYFASLERIIALQPRVIVPSHGGALGGVYYLEQALRHRQMREAQVRTLHNAGRSMAEMLLEIYRDVDPRLLPLAQINIESHLQKLREDGAIPA